MDSLLATYASSDEDDDEQRQERAPSSLPDPQIPSNPNADRPRSLLSSLPPPKSSHLHLPPPKSQPASLSSGFRALPPPESAPSSAFSSLLPPSSSAAAKKVVQFRPPLDPSLFNSLDDDDDDDENLQKRVKKEKEKKPIPGSGPGRIASFLPPPQHLLPPTSSGRRTAVDAGAPVEVGSGGGGVGEKGETVRDAGAGSGEMGGYHGAWGGGVEGQLGSAESGAAVDCGPDDAGYYTGYADYGGCWDYGGAEVNAEVEMPAAAPVDVGRIMGKRGRDGTPLEIVEVKQEELVKDRPREDKLKATGIAFGPAYQPVSSSGKGKPSKLHRRKHQIGSLYFDMKQKESELMERRAKGMLTKKETQGKYGW